MLALSFSFPIAVLHLTISRWVLTWFIFNLDVFLISGVQPEFVRDQCKCDVQWIWTITIYGQLPTIHTKSLLCIRVIWKFSEPSYLFHWKRWFKRCNLHYYSELHARARLKMPARELKIRLILNALTFLGKCDYFCTYFTGLTQHPSCSTASGWLSHSKSNFSTICPSECWMLSFDLNVAGERENQLFNLSKKKKKITPQQLLESFVVWFLLWRVAFFIVCFVLIFSLTFFCHWLLPFISLFLHCNYFFFVLFSNFYIICLIFVHLFVLFFHHSPQPSSLVFVYKLPFHNGINTHFMLQMLRLLLCLLAWIVVQFCVCVCVSIFEFVCTMQVARAWACQRVTHIRKRATR